MEKMMSKTNDNTKARELTADELKLVSGGADDLKAEAQIFQALSSAISEVMKNFGSARASRTASMAAPFGNYGSLLCA